MAEGDFVLIFKDPSPSCSNTNSYLYVRSGENGMTAEGVKNLLAASLTAAIAQKFVSINFDTSTSGCYINRMTVIF